MDQNGRPLEIEGKVNLTLLLINRNDASFYRTKNKKIGQTIRIFFIRKKCNTYGKQLVDIDIKPELIPLKPGFKKVLHKAAEETGQLIGNKSLKKIVRPKVVENSSNAEGINIRKYSTSRKCRKTE